jgi:hypothetical protein
VVTGKREMYDDAFELEWELREGGAKVIQAVENEQAERLLASAPSLGPGERAALRVAYESEADAILTDDRAFLGFLAGAGMGALVSAAAIVMLAERGALSVEGAMEALGRIQGSIRSEVYEAAMEDLAGRRGERMSKAKTTRPYPLRIPEGLMELAEAKARTERTDRSTALRQLLYAGPKATCLTC